MSRIHRQVLHRTQPRCRCHRNCSHTHQGCSHDLASRIRGVWRCLCMRLDADLPNRTMFRDDAGPDRFTICTSCEKALTARRVPEAALARIDPGDVPSTNHLGDPLPAPTFVESQLLGRGHLMQQLLIVHLAGRPPEVLPCAVQSHGIAVVNPDPNMLRGQLPARVADFAGAFTVVCVDQVRDRQDLLDRVRRAPGLKVRGNVIVAWVRFLQHNDEDEGAVDEEALQEYERMGCVARVPEALLQSAIGPTDPEVAGVLRSTFLHDRTGAAGVRQLQETLQGNVAGEIIQGGGAYGSPLDTGCSHDLASRIRGVWRCLCMRLDADLPNRTMFRDDAGPDRFTICTSCEKALTARRVPEAALARIDPGDVPSTNHLGDPLPAPTFVESQLLGRGHLMQQLLIVHLAGRPPEVLPCAVQSHGIAVVNPDPNMLRGQLPARVADFAGAFTVVCVDQVRDRQDLLDRVRRAPGLKVRGNVIVAWVRFLQHNDEDEGAVDEEALQEYERMGCVARVPEALLQSAIGPTDPEVAGVLRSTFLHDRTGAAGVRQLQETLQGNVAGEIIQGGGAYGSPLDTGPDGPTAGTTASDTRMADAGATGLAPVAVVVRQPADPGPLRADADLGVPNELEVVLPQPAPVPTDGSDFDNRPNVVHDLLTGRARLAFAAGGRGAQVLDDRHPAILNVCFPVSFPYGLSGQRPPGMSFASYCSHLVRRVPRAQFSSNLMLLARMYDISVRQQSMAQVGVVLRMRPRLGGPAARVPRDVVRTMADILALPYCHAQRRQLLSQQSPMVRALLDGARASLLRIDLTDTYYNGAKAMMHAAALTIGWLPLFFNLNPADMHAGCAVVASGQLIEFDDAGRPTQISSTVEKWRRVKEDPHSCAALLIATKEVLVEQLFGFAPGAMRQTDPNCFCGVVFEVVVKVEQSGRLALHLHGVAHVECFALDNLQALFCGPNCRALALAYALCEMWYPSPYYAPTPDSGTQPLVMGMSDAEAQQHGLPVPAVQADCPPAAYNFERLAGCANGGLPPPSRHAACRAHHAAVIRSTLTHSHSSTCKRHGCRGTDDSCGMAFPRLIRTAFQWIGTTGLFLLPRLAPNLVPHMPAIALAFGCNHLMSLACEVDRDYTADIAAQLARPPNERGDCPLLQPAIDRARDAAYYSSKYTAKTIERSQAPLTCAAVNRVQDFMMAGHQPSTTGDGPSTFGNLCTVVHRMTATITAGMALVAFKLSGHDTFEATYKRNYLPIGAFTALASESAVEPEDAETGVELVEADEHGDYTLTSIVQNYTHRGVELSGLDCSAYSIASNFEVKRITPAQHPHAAILSAQVLPVPGRRKRKAPGAAMTPTTDAPPATSGTQPTAAMASPAPAGPSAEQLPTSPMSTIPPKNVAFQPTHPLYLTHVLHRLVQPRYVLLGGALPRRPQAGSTTAAAVAYYAFVLGIFKAHRGQPVAAGQTVKEAYDAWWMDLGSTVAGQSYRACVSVLLDNIEAEHLASARRQADYNLRRRQCRVAAATAGLAPDNSSSDPDDDDPEAARGRLEPDPATQPPQDDQVERYDFVPGQGDPTLGINLSDVALTDLYDRTTAEGLYAYGAARCCRVLPLPNVLGANTNPFIRRVRTTDIPLLSEASKRLKHYLVISEGTATMPTTTDRTPRLRLDRRPGYPLVAVIMTDAQQTNHITAGMPTYLRLPQPPTIDDTVELFTLAPDQAVPFMLMARYFDRRNEPDPGVPPQMLIMGPPGTGKTQFVHALLWYTYQHDSPDWAATCAYSWAAVIAFNTPVHRSLSTHSMFGISASQSGSRGANLPKRGAHAGLQVKRNIGDGAVLIDEIGMQSHEHLGAISHSCTANVPPPPHLGPAHPSSRVLSGRAAGGIGDLLQHPQPGGSPPYRYAANVERNPQFSPSAPSAQCRPASVDERGGDHADGSNNDSSDADDNTSNRRTTVTTCRTHRPVPQMHTRLHDGFNLYRQLGGTVFMLQKQQRQDNSPSGQQLTRFATMFGGIQPTEARVADLVDALNQRVITDLSDLTDLEPRVVLQRNEPRHALNTHLLMLQARRKGARLVSWNADHVPVRQHGATQQQPLSHVEKAVAMRVKDATFDHTTADTWYYEGAHYTLLDTTAADAGACHNNEVEACGLLTDSREPPDDGRGPYWRLHYLPAAVLVRPIKGHAPKAVPADLADFATKGAAFAIVPRPSPAANITVPAANTGTTTKNVRRVNVPLGDYYAVTDYFVQGRSFKEECWVADLSVPPGGLKRATMYVLLTRYKTLDHIRLLRPLSTTPDERTRVVKQFMAATKLDPDLAAELRLLDRRATETRERYTTEYKHDRNLEERWTSAANTT
ncbi:hypothetical protein VOLCADRAFT_100387 [Volvox carteri f. nagariensis]|uniref:AAA+ ATPase domain-containing protein n=1 Tax=Volvox carteri f. nagariensis TaxID=3068 RepID=D8UK37_VOLCA|nr:uncharacterized protein VOLCADRAFT_100387 [Volvox carteri f. nagariensis]EFJ39912.1 hypothetical protein VOLCADRAFT_100387 [Volvox carteri f. nagariensis]|eukprot:XP_002959020.1 hypothetical protein VOLCADRAFT_100387 [Volvox carteri f. nagariensis]